MHDEIQLPQGTIRYRDTGGDGPVIVFVHGYLMAGDLWDEVIERLGGMRCIAPDWPLGAHAQAMDPGADLSMPGLARLISDFLDALALDDVTLVGNDSGGGLSQIVAAEHPERLGRLVLTPCDCFDNCPPTLFKPLVPLARIPGSLTVAFAALRLRAPRRLPFAYGLLTTGALPHERINRWVRAFYADAGVRRDMQKVTRGLEPEALLEAATKLARFDRPALIAFAPGDKLFPYEHAERLAAIIPDARLEPMTASRTWVMLDEPDRLAGLIQEFVAETSQSAGNTPGGVAPGAATR